MLNLSFLLLRIQERQATKEGAALRAKGTRTQERGAVRKRLREVEERW